jgi:hypothetical protein
MQWAALAFGVWASALAETTPRAPVLQDGWEIRGVWLQPEVLFVSRVGAATTALSVALKTHEGLLRYTLERFVDPKRPLFGEQRAWEARIDAFCANFLKNASLYPRPSVVIEAEKRFDESAWAIKFLPEESVPSGRQKELGPQDGALAAAFESIFAGKEPQWSAALLSCRDPVGQRWAHSVLRAYPTLVTILLKALQSKSQAAQTREQARKNPELSRARALELAIRVLEASLQRGTAVEEYLASTRALRALTEAQVAELRTSMLSLRESLATKLKETRSARARLPALPVGDDVWAWLWSAR